MLIKDTNKLSSKALREGRCIPLIHSFSCYGVFVIYVSPHQMLLYKLTALYQGPAVLAFCSCYCHKVNCISGYVHGKACLLSLIFTTLLFPGILFTSAISCGSVVGLQNKQMKEALFLKKVQQNVKEEQANHVRWQVILKSII